MGMSVVGCQDWSGNGLHDVNTFAFRSVSRVRICVHHACQQCPFQSRTMILYAGTGRDWKLERASESGWLLAAPCGQHPLPPPPHWPPRPAAVEHTCPAGAGLRGGGRWCLHSFFFGGAAGRREVAASGRGEEKPWAASPPLGSLGAGAGVRVQLLRRAGGVWLSWAPSPPRGGGASDPPPTGPPRGGRLLGARLLRSPEPIGCLANTVSGSDFIRTGLHI